MDRRCSFYCLSLNNESQWLFAKCETGRWDATLTQAPSVLRQGGSFVSPFPTSLVRLPTSSTNRGRGSPIFFTRIHTLKHVTCTEYAYRKPGSATFRHLRINVVISSALGNSLLTASYALFFQLTVLVEVLSACCACQSKPIYEYFSAENRVYV